MKAILLAAGKSTRTWPLTENKPKPLLKIVDKTILEHNIDSIRKYCKEIIIVVGFKKEKIKEHLKNKYKKIKITFVEQKQQKGTGHAVLSCEKYLQKEKQVLILNGDDLYSEKDIKQLVKSKQGILASPVTYPERFGICKVNKKGYLSNLVEKPKKHIGNLANTGCFLLDTAIFRELKKTKQSVRKEIELTSAVLEYAKKNPVKVVSVKEYWLPVGYPWQYLEANVALLKKKKKSIKGKIEKNVTIQGTITLGKGSVIKSGTYIEGPVYIGENCTIGPGAYIRPDTVIMDNVNTRAEIYDSVIMNNTTAKHQCYIGHSVLGENVNIGAGTITSDYRHDAKEHITLIQGKKIETGRRKLGAFIGDSINTGIGTLIYPGRKLGYKKTTLPGEIVKKDKV